MNSQKHRWVFYLITVTIIATITVQLYWNYKNYEENKQRVTNEIQISLDNALEKYYTNLSKKNLFAIVESETVSKNGKLQRRKVWRDLINPSNIKNTNINKLNDSISLQLESILFNGSNRNFNKRDAATIDSIFKDLNGKLHLDKNNSIFQRNGTTEFSLNHSNGIHSGYSNRISEIQLFLQQKATDSLKLIEGLQTIYIAIQNDSINYKNVDSLFSQELKNKGINSKYYFNHNNKDTVLYTNKTDALETSWVLKAKSTFLKPNESFLLYYRNPTTEALKRSSTGILLSLLLSLIIISSLFYLLKVINNQKELAEIKNDLISNITHEFKTPIATVSTAIEAIQNFDVLDDKIKTQKYLTMSSVQLKKLHQMVEKLLETATLDSENLMLKKEEIDLVELIDKLVNKHQIICKEKIINFSSNIKPVYLNIDVFHFENAISNLIDNAVKYGGENIEITINSILNTTEISVADDGNGIEKQQQEKIFDKFYRVPKGNTHDVKGFGIGLYYSKKIIEKHEGTLNLASSKMNTIFKINLPNE